MKIIGVYSIKGGVGKTSTAVNMAYLAAAEGRRTLVWDLDPQGAASFYFRVKPKVKGGVSALLRGKRELDAVIKGTDFELLDLLPADFSYRNMDILLEGPKKRITAQLERLLRPIRREYDLVFLDCPPSISLMSENIFRAAHALLVPVVPSTLSARTLEPARRVSGQGRRPRQAAPAAVLLDGGPESRPARRDHGAAGSGLSEYTRHPHPADPRG